MYLLEADLLLLLGSQRTLEMYLNVPAGGGSSSSWQPKDSRNVLECTCWRRIFFFLGSKRTLEMYLKVPAEGGSSSFMGAKGL